MALTFHSHRGPRAQHPDRLLGELVVFLVAFAVLFAAALCKVGAGS